MLIDLTKARCLIESYCIFELANGHSDSFVEMATKLIDELEDTARTKDCEAYHILDIKFHQSIIAAAGNQIFISLYKYLIQLFNKITDKTKYNYKNLAQSQIEHYAMLEAIIAHDGLKAKKIMTNHIKYR